MSVESILDGIERSRTIPNTITHHVAAARGEFFCEIARCSGKMEKYRLAISFVNSAKELAIKMDIVFEKVRLHDVDYLFQED
ncbi:hypothetical protein KIN20_033174 [Parelaphostrongylus tenuis]|uniref:Uncharacterized protein n=1 Tax=Parelaphostrongylus tenuis TaxID=148309 RepID=A0AAD5R7M8_PARTN|nr:hypothetical protein KIN20_033174 [Parelaphostrongylus tenuis]